MKAQTWLDEREPFLDTLVKIDAWVRRARTNAGRARRWGLFAEAFREAVGTDVLQMPFAEVPLVGYDLATMQELFVFTGSNGNLVVVSEKGVEALTLV